MYEARIVRVSEKFIHPFVTFRQTVNLTRVAHSSEAHPVQP